MEQWIEIAKTFGILGVILFAIGFFFAKRVWPFIEKQITDAQAQRREDVKEFIEAIRTRDVMMAETQREQVQVMRAMTRELTNIKDAVKRPR